LEGAGMERAEIFIKVRNYHADNHNHVNNARYLEFFEESSWDFVEKYPHAGKVYAFLMKRGIIHVVVNINCNYRSSAVVGDTLRIETELARSTDRSYTWSKKVYNDLTNKLVVDAELTCVFIDTSSGSVFPINEEMTSVWPELANKKVN
jgi:thioesterase III